MAIGTLTSKGQVTIPKEIRQRMALKEGDRLDFRLNEKGELTVRLAFEPTYLRLLGLLKHRARERPVTVEEMRQGVHERAAIKFEKPR